MKFRRPRAVTLVALAVLALCAGLAWWAGDWMEKGPVPPTGGLYFPLPVSLDVPHFSQGDSRWGSDLLGLTNGSLRAEGCAVASAAMTLAARGMDVDPGRLNAFLTQLPGGYTPRGWIYWEKAAEFDPDFTPSLLPHYEDAASHFLIDWNLLNGNPVIARLRYPSGTTHFVVISGKRGFEYLMRDPAYPEETGLRLLSAFGGPVEALRFYAR